jgi:hypothetical protein
MQQLNHIATLGIVAYKKVRLPSPANVPFAIDAITLLRKSLHKQYVKVTPLKAVYRNIQLTQVSKSSKCAACN